jgi:hypothetical protein
MATCGDSIAADTLFSLPPPETVNERLDQFADPQHWVAQCFATGVSLIEAQTMAACGDAIIADTSASLPPPGTINERPELIEVQTTVFE